MLKHAQKLLVILELTKFRWTIKDILEQPEAELQAVFALKAVGESVKAQSGAYNDTLAGEDEVV